MTAGPRTRMQHHPRPRTGDLPFAITRILALVEVTVVLQVAWAYAAAAKAARETRNRIASGRTRVCSVVMGCEWCVSVTRGAAARTLCYLAGFGLTNECGTQQRAGGHGRLSERRKGGRGWEGMVVGKGQEPQQQPPRPIYPGASDGVSKRRRGQGRRIASC